MDKGKGRGGEVYGFLLVWRCARSWSLCRAVSLVRRYRRHGRRRLLRLSAASFCIVPVIDREWSLVGMGFKFSAERAACYVGTYAPNRRFQGEDSLGEQMLR